jgi:multidrug resistance efflux pump
MSDVAPELLESPPLSASELNAIVSQVALPVGGGPSASELDAIADQVMLPVGTDPSAGVERQTDSVDARWNSAGFAVNALPVEPNPQLRQPALKAGHPIPSAVRPGGRLVGALVVVAFAGFAGLFIWNSVFRFRALGVLSADTIEVSAESDGLVQEIAIAEGAHVARGDVLAVLENMTLRDELSRASDQLQTAQAEISAEASRLQWELQVAQDGRYRLKADLHLEQGNTRQQEAAAESLDLSFQRLRQLKAKGIVTPEEFDRSRLALRGQADKVADQKEAVQDLQRRSDAADLLVTKIGDRIAPKLAHANALQSEIERLRARLMQLSVSAPIDGTVVKRHRLPGERLRANEPLVTLLADTTREAVLYLPESQSGSICAGDDVVLSTESTAGVLQGTVMHIEDRLQPAPESIQTFYRRGERLLAVHVRPDARTSPWPNLPLNSVVKLPRWGGVTKKGTSP